MLLNLFSLTKTMHLHGSLLCKDITGIKLPRYMSPKPPFPMILPRRHFFFSVSVNIHPSGRGQGNAFFLGAIDISKLWLHSILTNTTKLEHWRFRDFPFDKAQQLNMQIQTDQTKSETETVTFGRKETSQASQTC